MNWFESEKLISVTSNKGFSSLNGTMVVCIPEQYRASGEPMFQLASIKFSNHTNSPNWPANHILKRLLWKHNIVEETESPYIDTSSANCAVPEHEQRSRMTSLSGSYSSETIWISDSHKCKDKISGTPFLNNKQSYYDSLQSSEHTTQRITSHIADETNSLYEPVCYEQPDYLNQTVNDFGTYHELSHNTNSATISSLHSGEQAFRSYNNSTSRYNNRFPNTNTSPRVSQTANDLSFRPHYSNDSFNHYSDDYSKPRALLPLPYTENLLGNEYRESSNHFSDNHMYSNPGASISVPISETLHPQRQEYFDTMNRGYHRRSNRDKSYNTRKSDFIRKPKKGSYNQRNKNRFYVSNSKRNAKQSNRT